MNKINEMSEQLIIKYSLQLDESISVMLNNFKFQFNNAKKRIVIFEPSGNLFNLFVSQW